MFTLQWVSRVKPDSGSAARCVQGAVHKETHFQRDIWKIRSEFQFKHSKQKCQEKKYFHSLLNRKIQPYTIWVQVSLSDWTQKIIVKHASFKLDTNWVRDTRTVSVCLHGLLWFGPNKSSVHSNVELFWLDTLMMSDSLSLSSPVPTAVSHSPVNRLCTVNRLCLHTDLWVQSQSGIQSSSLGGRWAQLLSVTSAVS